MYNIESLWEIISLLHRTDEPHQVLGQILKAASAITQAQRASLWLIDKDKEYITPYAHCGSAGDDFFNIILAYGEGICGKCIKTGEVIYVKDCQRDKDWSRTSDDTTGFVTKSLVTVPVKNTVNGVFGCIQLVNKQADNENSQEFFTEEDAKVAALIAEQLGIWFSKNGLGEFFTTPRENVLEIRDVKKYYGTGEAQTRALDDVSLDIKKGELLVILGSSGSGKSTLLNMIGGMDKPTSGSITIHGKDIVEFSDKQLTDYRMNNVGFIFQFYNLLSDLTVLENVMIAAGGNASKEDAKEVLTSVGMWDKRNKYPTQLSGGEQQRVSIARALIKKSDLLLCDEPTGALDYETGRQTLIMLEKLARDKGQTTVIVTHTSSIALMADRVIKMRSGKIGEVTVNPTPVKAERIEW